MALVLPQQLLSLLAVGETDDLYRALPNIGVYLSELRQKGPLDVAVFEQLVLEDCIDGFSQEGEQVCIGPGPQEHGQLFENAVEVGLKLAKAADKGPIVLRAALVALRQGYGGQLFLYHLAARVACIEDRVEIYSLANHLGQAR